jgi:hypothetical protein
MSQKVPKIVFIVPYRNRPQHKFFFSNYLNTIMENRDDYEVYFHINAMLGHLIEVVQKILGF